MLSGLPHAFLSGLLTPDPRNTRKNDGNMIHANLLMIGVAKDMM